METSTKKIMIFGGRGMLGTDIQYILSGDSQYEILSYDIQDCNIADVNSIFLFINSIKPNIIINCAAYTNVDGCEDHKNKHLVDSSNINGPCILAQICNQNNIMLIHISTDYVFSGYLNTPYEYTEYDLTNPIQYYGISKLRGESGIKRYTDNYIIIRISWLFGRFGSNFIKYVVSNLKENKSIEVINDIWGTPTYTCDVALAIKQLLELKYQGIINVRSAGHPINWFEYAQTIANVFELDGMLIKQTTQESIIRPAKRPNNSALSIKKLNSIDIVVEPWENAIVKLKGTI